MTDTRPCQECGGPLPAHARRNRKFCSACYVARGRRAKREARLAKRGKRFCVECGVELTGALYGGRLICGARDCKLAAKRRRAYKSRAKTKAAPPPKAAPKPRKPKVYTHGHVERRVRAPVEITGHQCRDCQACIPRDGLTPCCGRCVACANAHDCGAGHAGFVAAELAWAVTWRETRADHAAQTA